MMSKYRKHNGQGGFTMVELIVILIILGILMAIMVPALSGWISKARDKQVLLEARSCLQASQAIGAEYYGAGKELPKHDDPKIMELAKTPEGSSISELNWFDGTSPSVEKMVYISAKDVHVTYENGVFTLGDSGSSNHSFGESDTLQTISDIITANAKKIGIDQVDSAALGDGTGSKAEQVIKLLSDAGIDLEKLGAVSWKLRWDTNGTSTNQFTNKLFWTPVDIQELPVGEKIPVMSYNFKTGTYTVWTMPITAGTGASAGKNILSLSRNQLLSPPDDAQQTYDQMIKDYEKVAASQFR